MKRPSVSEKIRDLYETYPYPTRMPGGSADPFLEYILSFAESAPNAERSFLDAGCGTGLNVFGGAAIYPHFQIYGCDLNRVALEQIRREAALYGFHNLTVQEMDLLHLERDFGPRQGFDVIYSTGVIHHTADPAGVLKSLAGRLAPQGVLRLMVYGKRGRQDLYRFACVARSVYGHLPWPERVREARGLMEALERSHRQHHGFPPGVARGPWEDALRTDDIEFADRYLNPHDQPFTVPSLQSLVTDSGLEFLAWFEPRDWDLEGLLPELAQSGRAPEESWARFALIEELFDRPMLDLYLVKPGFRRRSVVVDADTVVGLNPQCFLHCYKARGVSFHRLAQLRLGPERVLERDEGLLLETIGRRFMSVSEITAEMPQPSLSHWLPVVTRLVETDHLFCPHV